MSDELYSLIYILSEIVNAGFKCVVVCFMYLYIRRMK